MMSGERDAIETRPGRLPKGIVCPRCRGGHLCVYATRKPEVEPQTLHAVDPTTGLSPQRRPHATM
jgi:hypothetical protein